MQFTLRQSADQLGKSIRQVRYMIQLGQLPATKVAGEWQVNSADLPSTPVQVEAALHRDQKLRATVEDVLDLSERQGRRRYSVRDLRAVQIGLPLFQAATRDLGPEHPSTLALRAMLEHLACGCHRFRHAEKLTAYHEARDAASRATCELVIAGGERATWLLDQVEQDLMAALAGLLRRCERKRE